MKTLFGYAASRSSGNGKYYVIPATREGLEVKAHDLSGFRGSWALIKNYIFFPTPDNSTHDKSTLKQANDFCEVMNNE